MRRLFPLAFLLGFLLNGLSLYAQRVEYPLNTAWYFQRGDVADTTRWEAVKLPHTWNTDAYERHDYYRGTGTYRRMLHVPKAWDGKHIYITFKAASKWAEVYINGHRVGEHSGGYTAFHLDLTPYVEVGENRLEVRVDNSREDIPPISGDFTFMGGLYREAHLTVLPSCHFTMEDHGSDGVFISTPSVTHEEAMLRAFGAITNHDVTPQRLFVEHRIFTPKGDLLQTRREAVQLPAQATTPFNWELDPISLPDLWTPETPNLYRVETSLCDASGKVLDRLSHHLGCRWYRFDAKKGFYLNGLPYKLRGMCRHQDWQPYGVALNEEMHRTDFQRMKQMGTNFVRLAHYPQDDEVLAMCDREGMLVWEEIPVIDVLPPTTAYDDTAEVNLREMIRQHYNHPSVMLWGYMNEILLRTNSNDPEVIRRTLTLAKRLEQVVDEEDPTRKSAIAFHGNESYNRVGLSFITDIIGWNLYSGWYGGKVTGFERFTANQQERFPDHPVIISEYGAGSDRRLHSLQPESFDFSIEYQQYYIEHYVPVIEQTPYIMGASYWNLIDFASAKREESMPMINNKGLLYADRTPKDVYYYFQAAWCEKPVLHIACRDFIRVVAKTDQQGVAQIPMKVYTNASEVELFADGRSLGRASVSNFAARFTVPFREARTTLRAVAHYDDKVVEDLAAVEFSAVPATLDARFMTEKGLGINVGSQRSYTSEKSLADYLPDQPYTEGGWGYVGGQRGSTTREVIDTEDDPLYQSYRKGIESYLIDLPAGDYSLTLHLTDPNARGEVSAYLLGRDQASRQDLSAFTVRINGEVVEERLVPAEAGPLRVADRHYKVRHTGGTLRLDFESLQGEALLCGLRIYRK